MLQRAIDRGELAPGMDLELGTDLLIAPLSFRMLVVRGRSDDEYLDTLANAIEAVLKAAVR
jgi:Tetracyclin repressor-like, C-terminal domain